MGHSASEKDTWKVWLQVIEKKLHLQGNEKLDWVSLISRDVSIDQEIDARKPAEDLERSMEVRQRLWWREISVFIVLWFWVLGSSFSAQRRNKIEKLPKALSATIDFSFYQHKQATISIVPQCWCCCRDDATTALMWWLLSESENVLTRISTIHITAIGPSNHKHRNCKPWHHN